MTALENLARMTNDSDTDIAYFVEQLNQKQQLITQQLNTNNEQKKKAELGRCIFELNRCLSCIALKKFDKT